MLPREDPKRVALTVQLFLSVFLEFPAAPTSDVDRVLIDNAEMLTKCA